MPVEFTTDEIVESTGGSVIGPAAVAHGVTIDSRSVTGGELFVPIVAERDGHDFVGSATAAGASVLRIVRWTCRPEDMSPCSFVLGA